MSLLGILHLFSAVFLSLVVAGVISINENDNPKRMIRETLRRTGKLLTVLVFAGLIVQILTIFSGN